jgi:hypothetical protein
MGPGKSLMLFAVARTRPGLALLAVVLLGVGNAPLFGFYTRPAFAAALLALVCSFAACWGTRRQPAFVAPSYITPFLSLAAILLSATGVLVSRVCFYEGQAGNVLIRLATVAGFLLLISLYLWPGADTSRRLPAYLAGLFVAGAALRAGALFASPDPVVDVFALLQQAPVHLLQGRNPYASDYDSPYETERALQFGVPLPAESRPAGYPPLPILVALPFRAGGLDARWANVLCDLMAATVLYLTARSRESRLCGTILAGIYLLLPRAPIMIENAWYEPMLVAALGGGLYLVERGNRWLGTLLLALGLTGKQFGVMLLPTLWRARRHETLLLGVALATVLVVVFLPFFLWGPEDFLSIVLRKHLDRETQYNSITFLAALHDWFGVEDLPRRSLLLLGLLGIGLLAWRTPPCGTAAALWMGTSLFVFCLCHTQGYFNYFYMCEYLWLLGIASSLRPVPRTNSAALPVS